LTTYRLLLEKTNINGHDILLKSNEHESLQLDAKLNVVNKKWKTLIGLLNEVKDKFAMSAIVQQHQQQQQQQQQQLQQQQSSKQDGVEHQQPSAYQFMTKKINEHTEWLAKFNDLFIKEISPLDQLENERLLFELNVRKFLN
jgi:hypothetical protein